MWANSVWAADFFSSKARAQDYLGEYASVFNAVEGNATFYAIPSEVQVQRWYSHIAGTNFKFSFKMPRLITHELKLEKCDLALQRFFKNIAPLKNHLGPLMIQLPPSFDATQLDILHRFIKKLPASFNYAVEVRHDDFYFKQGSKAELNELLGKYRIDQVMFDTRALFDSDCQSPASLDAKAKKPRFPADPIALGDHPILRFMASPNVNDTELSQDYFSPWVDEIVNWIRQGKEPYVFVHTVDNRFAPELANNLHQQLRVALPQLGLLAPAPCARANTEGQMGLF